MRTKILSCFLFSLLWLKIVAQPTYQKTYGTTAALFPNFFCANISFDKTTQSLILGTAGDNGSTHIPGITKIDTCGNIIWSTQTGTHGGMDYQTSSIYNGTSSAYFSTNGSTGFPIGTIASFNSSGALTTVTTAYTSASTIDSRPVAAYRLKNGDHLITGFAARTGHNKDIWFSKIDLAGNIIWSNMTGLNDVTGESGRGIDVDTINNFYYFVGQNRSFSSTGSTDMHIIKTDVNGNMIWEKQIGSPFPTFTEIAYSVKVMPNSDVVIAGTTDFSSVGNICPLVIRLDAAGNTIWSYYYGHGGNKAICRNLNILPNGNLLLTGYTDDVGGGAPALQNGFLMELDGLGSIVWQKKYSSGKHSEFVNSVIYNNAIYTAGSSEVTVTGFPGTPRVWLVKTKLDGSFNSGSGCLSYPGGFGKVTDVFSNF